jgi:hypothetical protein
MTALTFKGNDSRIRISMLFTTATLLAVGTSVTMGEGVAVMGAQEAARIVKRAARIKNFDLNI